MKVFVSAIVVCVATAAYAAPSSVHVTLPADDAVFPGGARADAINQNCLSCHSAAMVLTQPKFTEKQWTAIVEKMVKTYHAPVEAADQKSIIAYLSHP